MRYEQATGKLFDGDLLIGIGWAGHLEGKNNPSMQDVKEIGPLPKGDYLLSNPVNNTHLGPLAFPLTPDPKNTMFGRSAFYLHAAEIANPEMSSDGCIIMSRLVRESIATKIAGSPLDSPLRVITVF